MKMVLQGCLGLVVMLTVLTAPLYAINKRQHLSPRMQAKVNNVLAKSYVYKQKKGASKGEGRGTRNECGSTQIGTVKNARGSRIDNVTVIKGDVITYNKNVKCL